MGWFGSIHLDAWRSISGAQVVAVCDVDAQCLQKLGHGRLQDGFHQASPSAARPSVDLPLYNSVHKMMARESLHILDVVAPESEHFSIAKCGLEMGVTVLVEKPLVTSLEQAKEIYRLVQSSKTNLYVGNILRFDPRQVTLKSTIAESGSPIRHMSFQRNFQTSALAVYGRVHPFFGACIHDIDLSIWFMNGPPKKAFSVTQSWKHGAFPDVVIGILEWPDGARAVIQNIWHLASSCPYGFEFETKVFLDDATCIVRNQPDLEIWDSHRAQSPELYFWPTIAGDRSGALHSELMHFTHCANAGLPSERVPLLDACRGIACAHALTLSAETGGWHAVEDVASTSGADEDLHDER